MLHNININKSVCLPDIWPQTKMPNVAAKPKAKLTVRNIPWEPPLNTNWATEPQPNIWRESREIKFNWVPINEYTSFWLFLL